MLGKKLTLGAVGNNQQAGGGGTDADFANTVLLLQGDTANTSLSYNVLSDASGNSNDLTPVDDVYGTTFSPHNTSWGAEFGGSGDYVDITNSSDFNFGSGDFTIEGWVYLRDDPASSYHSLFHTGLSLQMYVNDNTVKMWASSDGSSYNMVNALPGPASSVNRKQWFHFAVVRNGSTFTVYVDGVAGSTTQTSSSSIYNDGTPRIADYAPNSGTYGFNGYMSNIRIVKGTAIYTSNFTPSTTPLTAVSGTSLLTFNSNRFVDGGGNNNTLSPSGTTTTRVVNFSPFSETDTTTGSGRFDGSGDYLQSAALSGGSTWTMECWFYTERYYSGGGHFDRIFSHGTSLGNSIVVHLSSSGGNPIYRINDTVTITSSSGVQLNTWSHLALVADGTNTTMYLNGANVGSTSGSPSLSSRAFRVGTLDGTQGYFKGHISDFRYVNGTAVYTSAFTPPTTPLTSVSNTSLLTLQNRGANRNIGFIDSAHASRKIAPNGNVTQGSFSPFAKEDGKWGCYFDRSGDYIDVTNASSKLTLTGDYTIECWIFQPKRAEGDTVFELGTYQDGILLRLGVNGSYDNWYINGTDYASPASSFPTNQWNHVAITRSGTTNRLFANGTQIASTTVSGTINSGTSTDKLRIGEINHASGQSWEGYISNFRVIKGTALYTSGFTPPDAPLTSVTGTSVITCNSRRIIDSTGSLTTTPNGNVSVTTFSPFKNSTAYSPATNGGSAYFDGTGDYLTGEADDALVFGTEDFTIEFWCWLYPYLGGGSYWPQIVAVGVGNSDANTLGGTVAVWQGDGTGTSTIPGEITVILDGNTARLHSGVSALYQWTHVALTRQGTNLRLFQNGQLVDSTTNSSDLNATGFPTIGRSNGSYTYGFVSDVRIVTGTAIYTSAFTPPTAPLTKTDSTSLLLNFTNAGVYDGTANNVVEIVNDAHVENAVIKYGTGSIQFDGTGDKLIVKSSPAHEIDDGDFTIEFWANASGTSTNVFIAKGIPGSAPNSSWWLETVGGYMSFYISDGSNYTYFADSSLWSSYTGWVHVAGVVDNGTMRMYINGVQKGSASITSISTNNSHNTNSTPISIGDAGSSYPITGHLDDIRITKGVCRYPNGTTFTPPSAKLPNQ
jgi:hypothetical protein